MDSQPMTITTFAKAAQDRYFEDYEPGATYVLGQFSLNQEEIVEFARRFDPQPFHVDPKAAKASHYGGIIASGWHTGSCMMRLLVDHFLSPVASLGSPGLEEIRWSRPVRPGEVMTVRVTVEQARRSQSKPDRGLIHSRMEVTNEGGEVAMSVRGVNLTLCRTPG